MKRPVEVRLVIPDTGVLISLAHGDLLDVLFRFAERVDLVVTDVVKFEATRRKADKFDARRIDEFLERNSDRIAVDPTGFHELLRMAEKDPGFPLPDDIGELSIYGYINAMRRESPAKPTLVIFEDNWFVDNQEGPRPSNTHLLSLAAFLKYLEEVVPGFSFHAAMARITDTRPDVNKIEIDIPGENTAVGAETVWKPAIEP